MGGGLRPPRAQWRTVGQSILLPLPPHRHGTRAVLCGPSPGRTLPPDGHPIPAVQHRFPAHRSCWKHVSPTCRTGSAHAGPAHLLAGGRTTYRHHQRLHHRAPGSRYQGLGRCGRGGRREANGAAASRAVRAAGGTGNRGGPKGRRAASDGGLARHRIRRGRGTHRRTQPLFHFLRYVVVGGCGTHPTPHQRRSPRSEHDQRTGIRAHCSFPEKHHGSVGAQRMRTPLERRRHSHPVCAGGIHSCWSLRHTHQRSSPVCSRRHARPHPRDSRRTRPAPTTYPGGGDALHH